MERKRNTAASRMESNTEQITTDPNGSYTGVPEDRSETPMQDADDL